jgi:hypothetical protein
MPVHTHSHLPVTVAVATGDYRRLPMSGKKERAEAATEAGELEQPGLSKKGTPDDGQERDRVGGRELAVKLNRVKLNDSPTFDSVTLFVISSTMEKVLACLVVESCAGCLSDGDRQSFLFEDTFLF